MPQDSLGAQTRTGFGRGQAHRKKRAQDSGPFGTTYFLRRPLPLEQPAVEDQQVSIAAFPADVTLAAGDVVHPGLTSGSGQGLVAFGAVTGHDITMKHISVMLFMAGATVKFASKKKIAAMV